MAINREEWSQGYAEEQRYIEAIKDYWNKFNEAALRIAPEFEASLYHGPFDERRYTFDFDQYEDAESLRKLLEEDGIDAIVEDNTYKKTSPGRRSFEVTQEKFISKSDFKDL